MLYFDGFMNVPFEPPGYRFVGTEYWSAGTVSRWRMRSWAATSSSVWSFAVCRVTVPSAATSYTGRIKTTIRLWGPAAAQSQIHVSMSHEAASSTELAADMSYQPMDTSLRRTGLAARNAVAVFYPRATGVGEVRGRTLGRLLPGRYAEITNWTDLTTHFRLMPI
jgi:hypothetical protein